MNANNATPTLLVVGTGDVASALTAMATTLGWDHIVVDNAADAESDTRELRPSDSVAVLSHDEDVEGPALAAALSSEAGYIAAMGSRKTQQRRKDWLQAHDVSADLIDSIRGPAGLDIGADTPAEIAVSIVAEIIASRRGLSGAAVRDRSGPIHPEREAGTTEFPGG